MVLFFFFAIAMGLKGEGSPLSTHLGSVFRVLRLHMGYVELKLAMQELCHFRNGT